MESRYPQYQPLKWPPQLKLAQLHLKCSCPGKDNTQGDQCPCCGRLQKLKTTNWPSRNIIKDFKSYGGGIPAYFQLLTYFGITMIILAIVLVSFHIFCLQQVCQEQIAKCQTFLVIFKFCDTHTMYSVLNSRGQNTLATILIYLELGTFLYLIIATIGMKWWMIRLNNKKILHQEKVYSNFSLMVKNIPKFYQLDDIKKEIQLIVPAQQICELFYVHEIAQFQTKYKILFDLHFELQYIRDSFQNEETRYQEELRNVKQKFIELYQEVQELEKKLNLNNGRAIIVFNTFSSRQKVYNQLKINECSKFIFHSMKLFGKNSQNLHFFADKIAEPQEINWKYIGQSSVQKTKVRIQTTFIGVGFMVLCFMLLYFPIIKIDQEKIQNPAIGSILGLIISLGIQILSIVYRQIILRLIPARHPSSKESESYFVVITTVMFHFFFYVIAPGTYYIIPTKVDDIVINNNIKLKQLFLAVVIFLFMSLIVAFVDLRYRLYKSKHKRILSNWSQWGKKCQIRLHEELTWPSFPIEFKLMVILNIWSFNAFYIFQIPYLLILFVIVLFIIYWVDKKNIYTHYKMQTYLSIQLELSVQKHYIIMFLLCLSCGYAISAFFDWQYIFIGVMFILAIIVNYLLSFNNKKKMEQTQKLKKQTLAQVVRTQTLNPKASIRQNLLQTQMKDNYLYMNSEETRSLGSISYSYGYQEIYENYLSQFKNKKVKNLLKKNYEELVNGYFLKRQSEMTHVLNNRNVEQKQIQQIAQVKVQNVLKQ